MLWNLTCSRSTAGWAKVERRPDRGAIWRAPLRKPSKGAKESLRAHANKVTLLLGTDGKSAEVILPELQIESANVQLASTTLQSGAVTLKGLHIHAAYDSEALVQPTQAHVELASVEATDLLLARSSSMITVSRLALQALRLAAGTTDTITGAPPGARPGLPLPVPLPIVPLLALFAPSPCPSTVQEDRRSLSAGLEEDSTKQFAADVAQRIAGDRSSRSTASMSTA